MKSNKKKSESEDLLSSLLGDKEVASSSDDLISFDPMDSSDKSVAGILGSSGTRDEEDPEGTNEKVGFESLDIGDENDHALDGILDLSAKPTTIEFPKSREARTEIFHGGKTQMARNASTQILQTKVSQSGVASQTEGGYGSETQESGESFSSSEVSEYNEKTKVGYEATNIANQKFGFETGILDLNQNFDKASRPDPNSVQGDFQEPEPSSPSASQQTIIQPRAASSSIFGDSPAFSGGGVEPQGQDLDELDLSVAIEAREESEKNQSSGQNYGGSLFGHPHEEQARTSSLFGDSPVAPPPMPELTPEPQEPAMSKAVAPVSQDFENQDKTMALNSSPARNGGATGVTNSDSERTVAVTGFHVKQSDNIEEKVRVSVGQQNRSTGFSSWSSGVDGQLNHAENLKIAQEKILDLERDNEKLRRQNEQLVAASEIMKERADLLTVQVTEFKNDRDNLEQSFKNEMTLLKNHITRKDAELGKAQFKVDELESKLKFDMKKIRVRERELENRLELIRAEKNAIVKNKDEQILDFRRKIDILQMEVESYRQKVVELNKQLETSHDSFKRTTRALRLAMANLELHEENKSNFKKAD